MPDKFTKSIIVEGEVPALYRLWADFENFPHFMEHIKAVTKTGDRTSHWEMAGPAGTTLAWDTETTMLEENKRIGWRSVPDSSVTTSGQVTFTSLPEEQTEITVTLQYAPPAGGAGEAFAKLFVNPEARLEEDLRSFKQYAEGLTTR